MGYQSSEVTALMAQQKALDEQLEAAKEKETRLVLIEIVQKMREYGISLNELMGRKSGEHPDEPAAKYRDPVSGATWSGRGRAPHWIVGKDKNEFLIDRRIASREMMEESLFRN